MLTNRFAIHLAIGALLALPLWSSARAERTVAAAPPGAGEGPLIEAVNFPIMCSSTAQKGFNHAAWTLHSFWYPEALQGFSDIVKAEPDCAMASPVPAAASARTPGSTRRITAAMVTS